MRKRITKRCIICNAEFETWQHVHRVTCGGQCSITRSYQQRLATSQKYNQQRKEANEKKKKEKQAEKS